jgi:nucleoside-triphosphatase THEP1
MPALRGARLSGTGEAGFEWPEEIPWSALGPSFIDEWGHDDRGQMRGEHIEINGQTGSGKSYLLATILQQRAERWNTAEVIVLTKESDDSIPLLGWPIVNKFEDIRKYRQCVFWPQTDLQGEAREAFHEEQIYALLSSLWVKDANVVLAFDEIGYVEDLSRRIKKQIRMYWREGRSHHISIAAMKQRPVGVQRDQHSESRWKFVFAPAHPADMEPFAELLGRRGDWQPVLEDLDQTRHEFVVRNTFTGDAYISWVDTTLRPIPAQAQQRGRSAGEALANKRAGDSQDQEG